MNARKLNIEGSQDGTKGFPVEFDLLDLPVAQGLSRMSKAAGAKVMFWQRDQRAFQHFGGIDQ